MASPHARTRRSDDAGAALIIALLVVFTTLAACATLTGLALRTSEATRSAIAIDTALGIAESGAGAALLELRLGRDLGDDGIGLASGTLDGGRYDVTIEPPFGSGGPYVLRSAATWNGMARTVEIVVEAQDGGGSPFGFFAAQEIRTKKNVVVDSYDSREGTYASQAVNVHSPTGVTYARANGHIGSSGEIYLDGGTILGDALPGDSCGIAIGSGAFVSGSTAPTLHDVDLSVPPYQPPALVPTALYLSQTLVLDPGDYRFSQIELSRTAVLVITGPTTLWVDGILGMYSDSMIRVEGSAELLIHFANGLMEISGKGIVNESEDPSRVRIVHHGSGRVGLYGSSTFHGQVFAPGCAIEATKNAQLFGSLIGSTILLADGARLHLDEALLATSDAPGSLAVALWRTYGGH